MSKREKTVTAEGHVAKHVTHHEPHHEEKKREDVPAADAPPAGSKRKAEEEPQQPAFLRPPLDRDVLLAIVTRALHVDPKASARGGARASGPTGVVSAH